MATPPPLHEALGDVDVLIRVLGEVDAVRLVDGTEEKLPVPKQKSLEAVTYLALRESPVGREDLQAALWPSGSNSPKTFHNAIWAARRMLGEDRAGLELLPEPVDSRYSLGERITTDYTLFCHLVDSAKEAGNPEQIATLLGAALTLVEGEPFLGAGRGYSWAAPHTGLIVTQVVDAAEDLGEIRLAADDWRGTRWAVRRGLQCCPYDERLYRLLMRAAHASGTAAAVNAVFDEIVAALADPDDPEDHGDPP